MLVHRDDRAAATPPEKVLAPAEWLRYQGFVSDGRRAAFVLGRIAAKLALGVAPAGWPSVAIESGNGQPPRVAIPDIQVSISHAGEWALAGAGPAQPRFGVDVHVPHARHRAALESCLHPDEVAALEPWGEAERLARLHVLWSAKEAVLKALGVGLGRDPATVALADAQPGQFVTDGGRAWYRTGAGWVATVAVLGAVPGEVENRLRAWAGGTGRVAP